MYERLFAVSGIAMLGWVVMIFLPTWSVTRRVAEWAPFPVFLAAVYGLGVIPLAVEAGPGILRDFGNVDGVLRLLADADVALIVWIHILAFDHLVGVFIYRDNMRERVVPLYVQSLILFLTLMFGPLGFLLYYVIRVARRRGPAIGAPGLRPPTTVAAPSAGKERGG